VKTCFLFCYNIDRAVQAQDRLTKIDRSDAISQPAVFIGHGSPMVAIEFDDYTEQLCSFMEKLPPPQAIVVVSAHWETDGGIRVTANEYPEQIYDFTGFPDTLYKLTYPCIGEPELAEKIALLLSDTNFPVALDQNRGLDHGTWVPLYVTFPNVDVPVIQVSIPVNAKPEDLLKIGTSLSSLRKQGILLIGSGNVVHNLKAAKFNEKYAPVDNWAMELDEWIGQKLKEQDIQSLLEYQEKAPNPKRGIPTTEHFFPLFFVLGAMTQKDHFVDIYQGFHYGNISMRCFAFASNE
jgi:4,5-DOPA dioxygenase extradiol